MVTARQLPTLQNARIHIRQNQSMDVGLLGSIKAGLSSFKAAIASIFTRPPAPPPLQIPASVSVSVNGRAVNIQKEQFEPMIMSLPKSERKAAVANLQQTLNQRVADGLRLMDTILSSPTMPPPPKNEDVAAIGLALYALANQQGDAFTNGSFSVADPDGRLAKWLDTSPDVYIRSSSHLSAYQHALVDGHMNMQRGIDIPEGVTTGLPNGHRTMLYGTIPARTQPDGTTVPRRLFVKTESAGCRLSSASSSDIKASIGQNMTIRSFHLSDVGEMFHHLASYITSRGQQGIGTARKEHFPSNVATAYENAKTELSQTADGQRALAVLEQGSPKKGGGLCILRDNIALCRKELANGPMASIDSAQKKAITDVLDRLEQEINTHKPQESDDLRKVRLGNEVIINYQPVQSTQPNQPVSPPPPSTGSSI
ncbi:MAG: hypothetical protein J6T46_13765 [Victivallales bacterium]|nr:hypothetical protein [Victivallales bacterium]